MTWHAIVAICFVSILAPFPSLVFAEDAALLDRHNASGPGAELHFDEVARSVAFHDPRIRQAIQQVERARGDHQAARGAFDPALVAGGSLTTGAYYDLRRFDAELRQPTTVWGTELFVGYRIGRGLNDRWPTYYSDQTLSQGEVRAGLRVPVWRDGLIDAPRASRARTGYELEAEEQGLRGTRLGLELAATQAYWTWVSAGQQRRVAEALVELAEDRDAQLKRGLKAGSIAEFDVTDNERLVLERRDLLVAASRQLERAALDLALFLRDPNGQIVVPSPDRLPQTPLRTTPPEISVEKAQGRVLQCHPEIAELRAKLEAAQVALKLAKNQLAPELDFTFQVSRDLGNLTGTIFDETLPGTVFDGGLRFSMPLLLRAERGKAAAARANVRAVQADIDMLQDRLRTRTADAASAVIAAQRRVTLMDSVLDTTEELARGERRRFESGASNLIFVNLREQTAAAARIRYVDAVAVAEIEQTRWRVTTALPGCRT